VRKRGAWRFAFEVLFLAAVAAALTLAEVRPVVVVGVMALGWFIAVLFEWAARVGEPRFGRGLPPRYYVPQVALPPAYPVDQAPTVSPDTDEHDEDLTWIVSPAGWGEVLEDWPVLDSGAAGEETEIAAPDATTEDPEDELPPVVDSELTSELDLSPLPDLAVSGEEATAPEEALDEDADAEIVAPADRPIAPAPAVSSEEDVGARVEAEPDVRAAAPEVATAQAATDPDVPSAAPEVATPQAAAEPLIARHRIDPLAVQQRGRFRRRGARSDGPVVEVPARPPAARRLPSRVGRVDPPVDVSPDDRLTPGA
jgi:hypothetical protein